MIFPQSNTEKSSQNRLCFINPRPIFHPTLWCQLEDTFELIVTPQGMELVMVHIEVISQCFKKYRVKYKACFIFLLDTIQL